MTYRERRLRKAERLRGWASNRRDKAADIFKAGEPYRHDTAFATQPGHIPERARLIAREDRALQSLEKAQNMETRADHIETAAQRAIYSDDPDASERTQEKINELEAARERIKKYNASCRDGKPDENLLDEKQRATLATIKRVCSWQLGRNGALPGYATSNLSTNIRRYKQRLERC